MNRMSEKVDQLAIALNKAQAILKNAVPNSENPYYKSEYANLAAVWECARNAMKEHGLSITQTTAVIGEMTVLVTTLLHASGQWIEGEYPIAPCRQQKGEGWVDAHDPQAYGTAVSYARRYALAAIIGIATEDDDGEIATHPKRPETGKAETPRTPPPINKDEQAEAEDLCNKIRSELAILAAATGEAADDILEHASEFTDKTGVFREGKRTPGEFRLKSGVWQTAWMRSTLGKLRKASEGVSGAQSKPPAAKTAPATKTPQNAQAVAEGDLADEPVPAWIEGKPDDKDKVLDEIWKLADSLTSKAGLNGVDAVLHDAGLAKYDVLKKRPVEKLKEALESLQNYAKGNA